MRYTNLRFTYFTYLLINTDFTSFIHDIEITVGKPLRYDKVVRQ